MARVDMATVVIHSSRVNGTDAHIDLLDSDQYLISYGTYTEVHTSFDEALAAAKILADKEVIK